MDFLCDSTDAQRSVLGARRLAVPVSFQTNVGSSLEECSQNCVKIDVSRRYISLGSLQFKVNLEAILGQGGGVPPERRGRRDVPGEVCFSFRR